KSNTVRFLCGNEKSKIENITDDVCGMIDLIRQDIGSRTRSVRTHDEGHGRRTQDEGHGRRAHDEGHARRAWMKNRG
ncbi:hypothetical protein Tco_1014043, partial [Tanacetum coccineum]